MPKLSILLPDIVDSTPLYVARGDEAALKEVGRCLDTLRRVIEQHGGRCVHTKGDDILSVFDKPSAAMAAAVDCLGSTGGQMLKIHAGLHFGSVIESRGAIFGEAVIMCARLAGVAKPDELLASKAFVKALGDKVPETLRPIDPIIPKGATTPFEVYSMTLATGDGTARQTALNFAPDETRIVDAANESGRRRQLQLRLELHGKPYFVLSGRKVTLGRAPDCDLVAKADFVSRHHAVISFNKGRIELKDQSSLGTYVLLGEDYEFHVHRDTVVLPFEGVLSPVVKPDDARAELIRFSVV